MLRNHTGIVVPRAFPSCWRLCALDQIQLDAYCTVVKQLFSILCSDLNFPFCICRCRFSSVFSFCALLHQTNIIYDSTERCHLFINGTLKMGGEKKKAPGHYLITLGPLNSWLSRNVSRTLSLSNGFLKLWGCSWFISPSFNFHSSVELRRLHQRALWICNPRKLLNSLPQSHVVAEYISKSLPFVQVWWVIYSPSPLQTPKGHFSFVVSLIFFPFLSFQDITPTFWRITLSF